VGERLKQYSFGCIVEPRVEAQAGFNELCAVYAFLILRELRENWCQQSLGFLMDLTQIHRLLSDVVIMVLIKSGEYLAEHFRLVAVQNLVSFLVDLWW
jgi:hypothetical protein